MIVVRHERTGRFLGPGCLLATRAGAVPFESADEARAFLARHAPEPCFVPVELSAGGLGTAA